MATENVMDFLEAAMTDRTLAEKLAALASENGFECTAEELLELGEAMPIADDETDGAVGGKNPPMKTPTIGGIPIYKKLFPNCW